jgi:hypothetical protein
MIIEDYGDFVRVKHVVSMRQVIQIKHQGENHNKMLPYNKNNA